MKACVVKAADGTPLNVGVVSDSDDKPWVVVVLPFAFEIEMASVLFDSLKHDFNLLTWESRLILANPDQTVSQQQLTLDHHVSDLMSVMAEWHVRSAALIGYCSGAGVAMAAAQHHRKMFSQLALISGEYLLDDPSCLTQYSDDISNLLTIAAKDENMASFVLDRLQNKSLNDAFPGVSLPYTQPHYFHRYGLNYLNYRQTDFLAMAKTIETVSLVIAALDDEQTNVASAECIYHQLPDATLIKVDGDHYEVLRPDSMVIDRIKTFLMVEDCGVI